MPREFVCEACGHNIAEEHADDEVFITACRHLYHYRCLYPLIYDPMERQGDRWITRCKRCKAVIGPKDYRKVEPHVRRISSPVNDPRVSPRAEETNHWRSMAIQFCAEREQLRTDCERTRTECEQVQAELNEIKRKQAAELLKLAPPSPAQLAAVAAAIETSKQRSNTQPNRQPTPITPQPVPPPIQPPIRPPSAPLHPAPFAQSPFYQQAQPSTSTYRPPQPMYPHPHVGIPRTGETFLNTPHRYSFHYDRSEAERQQIIHQQCQLVDMRQVIEQNRARTAAPPDNEQRRGTKRSSSESPERRQTARKHTSNLGRTHSPMKTASTANSATATVTTTLATPTTTTNTSTNTSTSSTAVTPGTSGTNTTGAPSSGIIMTINTKKGPQVTRIDPVTGRRMRLRERIPPPPMKKGTTKEKASNLKKYRQRYGTDPEELRPYYPLNSFPYDFLAAGYEIDEDHHYVVFFAHDIILIGDGHVTSMVHKLASNKPYSRKLNPHLYKRNLTLKSLCEYVKMFKRFPKRIMISIGNFDTLLATPKEDFERELESLQEHLIKLGTTEIIIIPLLPTPRTPIQRRMINQALTDWGTNFSGTTTRVMDIFEELHQIPPLSDISGSYYEPHHYHDILQRLATQFIPPLLRYRVTDDEDEEEPAANIQQGVESMNIESSNQSASTGSATEENPEQSAKESSEKPPETSSNVPSVVEEMKKLETETETTPAKPTTSEQSATETSPEGSSTTTTSTSSSSPDDVQEPKKFEYPANKRVIRKNRPTTKKITCIQQFLAQNKRYRKLAKKAERNAKKEERRKSCDELRKRTKATIQRALSEGNSPHKSPSTSQDAVNDDCVIISGPSLQDIKNEPIVRLEYIESPKQPIDLTDDDEKPKGLKATVQEAIIDGVKKAKKQQELDDIQDAETEYETDEETDKEHPDSD